MEVNASGMIEELHVEDEHEESFDLQVSVKWDFIEYLGQNFDLLYKYIQENIPIIYTSENTYVSMDWTNNYIT